MDWASLFGLGGGAVPGGILPPGPPVDPTMPNFAALMNPSMGPDGQFMTMNPGAMGAVPPGPPLAQPGLAQPQVDNAMGPLNGQQLPMTPPGLAAPTGQPPLQSRPGLGFTPEQAAVLARMGAGGAGQDQMRPPAAPAAGGRSQAPGMTTIQAPRLSPARMTLAAHSGFQRARGG